MSDELEGIFKKYANTTMPWEKERLFTQPMRAEIEAACDARFERALQPDELAVGNDMRGNIAAGRNNLRAEARTRWAANPTPQEEERE